MFVLFVVEKGAGGEELEADVVGEEFVLLEEGVDLFEVVVAEVALAQEVEGGDVILGEGGEFICEEDGVGVVVDVEVIDGEFV